MLNTEKKLSPNLFPDFPRKKLTFFGNICKILFTHFDITLTIIENSKAI